MTRQMQDAYIVAATRTAVGKAPRGAFKSTRPDTLLAHVLPVSFTATCMKGRSNYLCLHKLDQLQDGAGPAVHDVFLPMIREWSARTEIGDRADRVDQRARPRRRSQRQGACRKLPGT